MAVFLTRYKNEQPNNIKLIYGRKRTYRAKVITG